jgi:hypothetical protein
MESTNVGTFVTLIIVPLTIIAYVICDQPIPEIKRLENIDFQVQQL